MTVYLVDFENVRSEGLRGVEELSEGDKVVIFYSKNADAITFDVHMLLSKSRAEIETFRILRGGRNSLDFQLSTYLGYLVMENCYKNIVIISQDKGFLCATSFWEENQELCNCNIKLCKSIATSDIESSSSDEFDDGLTGKFIEKIDVIKTPFIQDKQNEKKESSSNIEHRGLVTQPTTNRDSVRGGTQSYDRHTDRGYDKKNTDAKQIIKNYSNVPGRLTEYKTGNYRTSRYNFENSGKFNETNKFNNSNRFDNVNNYNNSSKFNNTNKFNTPNKFDNANKFNPPNKFDYTNKFNNSGKFDNKDNIKTLTEKKPNLNIQNPTSKNKIFTAEVKLNITDDIKNIISGKYEEDVVPILVETIGKSTGKQHFYRMLVSRLGQEKGHDIYMMIKGQYANLKRK